MSGFEVTSGGVEGFGEYCYFEDPGWVGELQEGIFAAFLGDFFLLFDREEIDARYGSHYLKQ